ncbi:MAG TPA: ATP-binding protein [Candidatus Sulfopaludibacter sp.]|nr:ATP-binding protein [Candidatus Sulfopaludibacter sp.]
MKPTRRLLIYGFLLGVWLLVAGWQVEEHVRIKDAARTDLRNRSTEIANTLSAVIRAMSFRDAVLQDRLEPVLKELVNERTNELVGSSELLSIALLNTAGNPVVSVGRPVNLQQQNLLQEGEHWGAESVTFVTAIAGVKVNPEGETNATVVLPSFQSLTNTFTNAPRGDWREFPRRDHGPDDFQGSNVFVVITNDDGQLVTNEMPRGDRSNDLSFVQRGSEPPGPPPPPPDRLERRRPFWLRWMSDAEFNSLVKKQELHGLVMTMSTKNYRATCTYDSWLRCIVTLFAGISVVGIGLAWRNTSKTSELQIRLVRASELNSHLREMNLAAAGLAHETRNPLNIIRGMAQMLSKQTAVSPQEIQEKSRAIVNETDKVTAQLNEFINYSRPREVRRSKIALNSAINEVVRTLAHDIEEKKLRVEAGGDPVAIKADEHLLRQVLFNLVLNAVQAVDLNGQIQISTQRINGAEAALEIRDNGPGVPPEHRQEIFKPYFTTNQKGTGLGLAVVQQIVLAHGWEIECLANEPKGALFRITHLKIAA